MIGWASARSRVVWCENACCKGGDRIYGHDKRLLLIRLGTTCDYVDPPSARYRVHYSSRESTAQGNHQHEINPLHQTRNISTTMPSDQYRNEEQKILGVLKIYLTRKAQNPATTINGVANEFAVSRKRLWRCVHNLPSRSTQKCTNLHFDDAQYTALFEYLDRLEAWCTPATPLMLKAFADSIL